MLVYTQGRNLFDVVTYKHTYKLPKIINLVCYAFFLLPPCYK